MSAVVCERSLSEMQADSRRKVLFVSHEASRTGAPLVLLNFLKWLKSSTNIPFLVLLRTDGEMESEFQELGLTLVLARQSQSRNLLIRQAGNLLTRFAETRRLQQLKARLIAEHIGLVYSNTMTNGNLLRAISYLNCPVITHVHEPEYLIRKFGFRNWELVKRHTNHFIAASQAVRDNLVSRHGVPFQSLDVVHSSIPVSANTSRELTESRPQIVERLAISHESLIVGACGQTCQNKGTDLFVRLARMVRDLSPETPVHFVWVGPETRELRFSVLRRQVDHSGLKGCVHFIGKQPRPRDFLAAFDIFVMTSRDEALGLAMLEAASVGKPIVCFGGAGGPKEFVEQDCGFVIPFFDLGLMVQKIILLLKSSELRERLGKRASQKLAEKFATQIAAPKIVSVMQRFFPGPESPEF
jgi:glycosyltransferase involved in cell wall biosynthesis